MALEDKDFILRQIKQTVRNMGSILGLATVKDLLAMDAFMQDVEPSLVDTIYYVELIHDQQIQEGLSDQDLANRIGISVTRWQELYETDCSASEEELDLMRNYFE